MEALLTNDTDGFWDVNRIQGNTFEKAKRRKTFETRLRIENESSQCGV
jgi:hypothetical protein